MCRTGVLSWLVAISPVYSQYLPNIPLARVYNGHVDARQAPVGLYQPAEVLSAASGAEIKALGSDKGLPPRRQMLKYHLQHLQRKMHGSSFKAPSFIIM